MRLQLLYSFRNLKLHPLRSALSTLGIFFGVVAVVCILSICEGSKKEILNQIVNLGLKNIILKQMELSQEQKLMALLQKSKGLKLDDLRFIQTSIEGIDKIAALKIVPVSVQQANLGINPEILAVSSPYFDIKGLSPVSGRLLCERDCKARYNVCVLGAEIAKCLGKKGHVGQHLNIGNITFDVVGILEHRNAISTKVKTINERDVNKAIFIPINTELSLARKLPQSQESLNEILIKIFHVDQIIPITKLLKRTMQIAHHDIEDYQLLIPEELLQQERKTRNLLNLVLVIVTTFSMLTGGIGIMNIMLASVFERTREIGIRRAIGATKFAIIRQFVFEALLLSLFGATFGIAFGVIFSYTIGYLAGWPIDVSLYSIELALGLAFLVGLFSGLYPAVKAANLDPIAALRHF